MLSTHKICNIPSSLSNPPALYPAFTWLTVLPIFCFLPGLCQLPLIYSLRHIQHADIELCNSDGLTPLMIAAVEGSNILCDVSHPFITLAMNFLLPVSLLLFSLKYSIIMIAFFRSTSFDQFFRLDKEDTSFYIYLPSYCTWYLYLHIHNIFIMFMSDFSQLPVLIVRSLSLRIVILSIYLAWFVFIPHAELQRVCFWPVRQSVSSSVLFFLSAQLLWNHLIEFRETL